MPPSPTARPLIPPSVWLTAGRYSGTAAHSAHDVLRRTLHRLEGSGDIDSFLELPEEPPEAGPDPRHDTPDLVFQARTRVAGSVTVRARLSVGPGTGGDRPWVLVAEAEQPWDLMWPSPTGMFWPMDEPAVEWNHDAAAGLRLGEISPLPEDDKAVRRLMRDCARHANGWNIHVVVHEAMTTDDRGRVPLARWLPPGLRHRVVEHRAAPHQLRVVNWALRDCGVEVPRGGAVVLPGSPVPDGYDAGGFSVRAVFLDGTRPADLVDAVTRFAALPRPLPAGAEAALTALREGWRLLNLEEELARERRLVSLYAEALEAMTTSRDLYREAAESAYEALTAYRGAAGASGVRALPPGTPAPSPMQRLTRTFERLGFGSRARRPSPAGEDRRAALPAADAQSTSSGP
ncbi:hypothetical protein OH738_02400 [Streptomyces hirsutus]|uniref:Uncharacterized protein n=1 Tax=Streptomyces hirsutus TaxID=35620 RepID=A0ABZ1H0S3_9ACTN|nr:hypothetical protein [Streptomyces hirsutus]WSD10864.1 hypothetical protein OIE73_37625 [Streptomyces hirsutus]WTD15792.1 hypothetical protein OH738_02400 [Streptomyces hirsutus]